MIFTEEGIVAKLKGYNLLIERITLTEFELKHGDFEDDGQKHRLEAVLRQTKLEVARLERYISLVDPKCASILQAVYIFGLTYAETCEKLAITEYAAHKRRRKGIKELTEIFNRSEALK